MASGIRNPNATYGYTGDGPDWENSVWTFRKEQTGDDRDRAGQMTSREIVGRVDRKKVRELLKIGGDVEAYVNSITDVRTEMSAEKATLARMTVKVEGPFFTIPEDYTDESGRPHPMAGKLIPQPPPRHLEVTDRTQYDKDLAEFAKWLGLFDPEERSAAMNFMTAVWAGRDPSDIKRFQGDRGRMDEPSGRQGKTGTSGK